MSAGVGVLLAAVILVAEVRLQWEDRTESPGAMARQAAAAARGEANGRAPVRSSLDRATRPIYLESEED